MCSRSMRARASARASPSAPVTSTARSASASARSDAPDSNSAETRPGNSGAPCGRVVAEQRDGAVEEADLAGEIAARVGDRRRGGEPLARPLRGDGDAACPISRARRHAVSRWKPMRASASGNRSPSASSQSACRSCSPARADFASEA